jgi:menaquinone reductase, molybdopterin-binding-like subunit
LSLVPGHQQIAYEKQRTKDKGQRTTMKRREFIILTGIGATSAGMLSACGHPEEKLIPALIPDEEYVPGIDVWKASTCAMCDAGCGIVVRTRDHKANKIEGNPEHPVNRGALCAKGQAGLQVLYNPDRIKSPLKRVGERFSGQFEEITWDEAIKTLAEKLGQIKVQNQADSTFFLTNDYKLSITAHIAKRFMDAYGGGAALLYPVFEEYETWLSYSKIYHSQTAIFDIANATYLLSFGARFLETWHSPVRYSLAYGEFRRAKAKTRGKFIQVEPRMSLTGANADEWLPGAAGFNGHLALAIAKIIISENLAKAAVPPELLKALEGHSVENLAKAADIPVEKIVRIAREFVSAERPLAIGSNVVAGTIGEVESLNWVHTLNLLVGNINKTGGVLLPTGDAAYPFEKLKPTERFQWIYPQLLADVMSQRTYSAFLIHQANPVYFAPHLADKIKAIPFVASFSSFMDETTQLSDLILPDHTSFERWDLHTSQQANGDSAINLTQPVVKPEFNTKQTADVLLAVSRALGDKVAAAIPFASAEEIVKQDFTSFANVGMPIAAKKAETSEEELEEDSEEEEEVDTWKPLSEKGFLISKPKSKTASEKESSKPVLNETLNDSLLAEAHEDKEYPFTLLAYEHPTLAYGEQANLPLLQELPDAMTSVMWGSWLEINPKTAVSLGIRDGDLVEVASPHGAVRAPAVVYPAIRPDVVAMPCGQGHTGYGRYAKGIGANALLLNPISNTPNARIDAIHVKISKVSSDGKLIRYGTNLPEHIEIKR